MYITGYKFININEIQNQLKLDSFIRENKIELVNELKDIYGEIKKIKKVEITNNYIELYSEKNKKEQYFKLYRNGDYTFFSNTFNY